MNIRTVYGIHGNDSVTFLDLVAAEKYLYANYPEYMSTKDKCMEYCQEMIWESDLKVCEGCGTKILYDDMDEYWIKPRCCDVWFCHEDCHN